MSGNDYMFGGGTHPLSDATHPDNALPAAPSLDMPGAGDDVAMQQYIDGKEAFAPQPIMHSHGRSPNQQVSSQKKMEQHGARIERRKVERQSKSTKPGADLSSKKMGY